MVASAAITTTRKSPIVTFHHKCYIHHGRGANEPKRATSEEEKVLDKIVLFGRMQSDRLREDRSWTGFYSLARRNRVQDQRLLATPGGYVSN